MWLVVMTISVHYTLKSDLCKSLYKPNFVGPILTCCMFSCYYLNHYMFADAILGYFILGPSPSNKVSPYYILQGQLILGHFPRALAHIAFCTVIYTILAADHHDTIRH
jgi:hypothetical protein